MNDHSAEEKVREMHRCEAWLGLLASYGVVEPEEHDAIYRRISGRILRIVAEEMDKYYEGSARKVQKEGEES